MNQLLRIGSNTQANLALRNLYRINNKVAMHQERLSTGKRINSAKDDAAGFALSSVIKRTSIWNENRKAKYSKCSVCIINC